MKLNSNGLSASPLTFSPKGDDEDREAGLEYGPLGLVALSAYVALLHWLGQVAEIIQQKQEVLFTHQHFKLGYHTTNSPSPNTFFEA